MLSSPKLGPECVPPLALSPKEQLRIRVLRLFREMDPESPAFLESLSKRSWKELLAWLDTSGLALYLLDVLAQRNQLDVLPPEVLRRLQQNFRDNTIRMEGLIRECCVILDVFAKHGIRCAVLKGFSLWPHAVHNLNLRSQLDLDFLIAASDITRACSLLEARGYRLKAQSGRSWEFLIPAAGPRGLRDLYKASGQGSVELHVEEQITDSLLNHCDTGDLCGTGMPVLTAPRQFVSQALHVAKHLQRDAMRTAHLLELYRHMLARCEQPDFWDAVRDVIDGEPVSTLNMSMALYLVMTQIDALGVPPALQGWTTQCVPDLVRTWVDRYGAKMAVASFPGTKLHLTLQGLLAPYAGSPSKRLRDALLPLRLPPPIAPARANETLLERLGRLSRQAHYVYFRGRFHAVEGFRFAWERRQWDRLVAAREDLSGSGAQMYSTARSGLGTKP